jgi:hypothetical protein
VRDNSRRSKSVVHRQPLSLLFQLVNHNQIDENLPEITNRVGIELAEIFGKGKGVNSGGYSSAGIGLNPRVLSIVETNASACFSSRLPCTNAIPFPEDQTEPTYDTRSLRLTSSVAANSSRLSYSNPGGFSKSDV